jgi:hypothetical protein
MGVKYSKSGLPETGGNIPTVSIPRPSKIYPNWDFGMKINHLATLIEDNRFFLSTF